MSMIVTERGVNTMMIDKIGGINPNQMTKKTGVLPVDALEPSQQVGDYKVNISAEANQAKVKAESKKLVQLLQTQTDPEREQRVRTVKEKVARNEYENLTTDQLEKMAESLHNRLLGKRFS